MSVSIPWLIPGLALLSLWWLLSGGAPGSWLVGLPAIALALWALRSENRPANVRPSPVGLLRFLPFFVAASMRGGWDVAKRTLAPSLRVDPGLITFRTLLQHTESRLLFVNCVSLLPGTLAADLTDDELRIHVLDVGMDNDGELQRLEQAVARVFHERVGRRENR